MTRIVIEYCPKCGWLPRAAWLAQELLQTFVAELDELALKPSAEAGAFRIQLGSRVIVDRKRDGGFPEITALKRSVRDQIAPDRQLGHLDRSS
ncbi:MAG: SelT/SelW/SelH family protein [Panacagrimonas sp.]